MLEARHIVRLKLDLERLKAHQGMPVPRHVNKPLIGQFSAIGEATISKLLGIDPDVFKMQLDASRNKGTSFVQLGLNNRPIGISAATSLIRTGDIMTKNVIVPRSFLKPDRRLSEHIIISTFVRGGLTVDGLLQNPEDVEIAGWASTSDLQKWRVPQLPPTFQTKLPVIMLPCAMLRPIETLMDQFKQESICV